MPNKPKATDDVSIEKQDNEVTATQNSRPQEVNTVAAVKATPPWPLITIGVFATVVVAAVFISAWGFLASSRMPTTRQSLSRTGMYRQLGTGGSYGNNSGDGSEYGSGGYRRSGSIGQTAAARGVITAVNGNALTVSGQGKQVTVNKSDSTTISGDKSDVAVNDTVVVYGTTASDGSITATQIVVRNSDTASGSMNVAPGA